MKSVPFPTQVYHRDDICKQQAMTPHERLGYHQAQSGLLMKALKDWLQAQLDQKKVEPNSSMGKAVNYMLSHWAPLDNNICEQALKKAILHRKNSYFFKTEHG